MLPISLKFSDGYPSTPVRAKRASLSNSAPPVDSDQSLWRLRDRAPVVSRQQRVEHDRRDDCCYAVSPVRGLHGTPLSIAATAIITKCNWSASNLRSRRRRLSGSVASSEGAIEDCNRLENVTSPRIFSGRVRVKLGKSLSEGCEKRITFWSFGTSGVSFRTGDTSADSFEQRSERNRESIGNSREDVDRRITDRVVALVTANVAGTRFRFRSQ
jgi:hypothetical protein